MTLKNNRQRNSNVELLKLFAILGIIIYHLSAPYTYTSSGLDLNLSTLDLHIWVLQFFRYFGQIGNAIFIFCSGYYLIVLDFSLKKALKLILETLFYSYFFLVLLAIIARQEITLDILLHGLFPIQYDSNWYINSYIFIYIFSPIINQFFRSISQKKYFIIVIVLLLLFSVLPLSLFFSYGYFTSGPFNFFIIYVVAGYIRFYKPKILNKNSFDVLLIALGFLMIIFYIVIVNLLGAKFNIAAFNDKVLSWSGFVLLPCVLISVGLFCAVIKLPEKNNAIVNKASSTSLGVLLIHHDFIVRGVFLPFIFHTIFNHISYDFLIPIIIGSSIAILLVCVVIDILRQKLLGKAFNKLADLIYALLSKLAHKVTNKIGFKKEENQ